MKLLKRILRRRVSHEVQAQLEGLVTSGAFRPGERLPSERDLTEALGVSRAAIREGLRGLEVLGLVTIRHGSGVYVQDGGGGTSRRGLGSSPTHASESRDLIEIRLMVEPEIAALAAKRATAHDLRRLQRDVEELRVEIGRIRRPPTDLGFHVNLCQATHNPTLLTILKWVIQFYARSGQLPEARDVKDHGEVFGAVRRRDAAAARRAMRAHLEWVRRRL